MPLQKERSMSGNQVLLSLDLQFDFLYLQNFAIDPKLNIFLHEKRNLYDAWDMYPYFIVAPGKKLNR